MMTLALGLNHPWYMHLHYISENILAVFCSECVSLVDNNKSSVPTCTV